MLNNVSLALIETRSCNWYVEFNISAILNSAKRFDLAIIKHKHTFLLYAIEDIALQEKRNHCNEDVIALYC